MTILCATDFSPCSDAAVRLASAIARRRRARLVLLHAIETPVLAFPDVPIGPPGWDQDVLASAEETVWRQAGDLHKAGIDVEARVLFGDPALHIVETAREVEAELVVVGTHGREGLANLLVGSIAEYVVRASPCPVLVAREDVADLTRWEQGETLRLVLGADGSGASPAMVTWAGRIAGAGACDLDLVWVYWPPEQRARYGLESGGGPGRDLDLLPLLERDVEQQTTPLIGARPLRIHFRAAERDAAAALLEEAARLQADAIVVGVSKHPTHGSAALAAASVLRASSLPVFCVPEAALPAARSLPRVRSVLVATDLSRASDGVIRAAYALLRPAGGRVELCTVHERSGRDQNLGDEERAALESRLAACIPPEAAQHGIETHVSVIEGPLAADAIVKAAERLSVDLVAVGSHGRSGLGRLVLGSVAEAVARRSRRGVLIARD